MKPWTNEEELRLREMQRRKDDVTIKLRTDLRKALTGLFGDDSNWVSTPDAAITYMITNAKDIRDALALADDGERPPRAAE